MIRRTGRYAAVGPEAEFEPGSRGRVLRNLLGIRSVREMNQRETEALLSATQRLIDETRPDQRFTADDVCRTHFHGRSRTGKDTVHRSRSRRARAEI